MLFCIPGGTQLRLRHANSPKNSINVFYLWSAKKYWGIHYLKRSVRLFQKSIKNVTKKKKKEKKKKKKKKKKKTKKKTSEDSSIRNRGNRIFYAQKGAHKN